MKSKVRRLFVPGIIAVAALLAAAASGGELVRAQGADPDAFTVIVLPDTQIYSQNHPHIFLAQTEWIVRMAEELNIKLVLHAGDVVNRGVAFEEQWVNAEAAMKLLDDAGIPTFIAIGNHDYDDEARTRSSGKFNEYFGIGRYLGKPWFAGAFEEGKSDNVYGLMEAGGIPFLVMALEFGPRRAVIDWANDVIARHPERDVIVVTHAYMYDDDTRMSPGDSWNPKSYGLGRDAADGEDMWRELFSRHGNVRMILSGHVLGSGAGRRIDPGAAGNAVHQILANYQMRAMGGEGYLRIMQFRPSEGIVDVKTYSPYLDRYLEDERQQFVITYDRSAREWAEVEGRIVDATRNRDVAGAVVSTRAASGEFYGVEHAGAGGFAVKVPPGTYRFEVRADGYKPATVDVAIDAAGPHRVEVPLVPLPYVDIAVGGVAPQQHGWTGWFSGSVAVDIAVGPEDVDHAVLTRFSRVVEGELFPLWERRHGSDPPGRLVIDTTTLEDGTYEVAVEAQAVDGTVITQFARFGVRNWLELVDDLLSPLQNAWFGAQSRKRTVRESSGWTYAAGTAGAFFGDADRLVRTGDGEEWLVWQAPTLREFEITLYAGEPGDVASAVSVEVSPDGESWTPAAFTSIAAAPEADGGFSRVQLVGALPPGEGAAYLRLVLSGPEPSGKKIHVGRVRLRSYLAQ